MFNLYQNLNKKDEDHKESDVTGHDRFWQERPRTRRKRRAVNRRTQSAIEFDSEAIVSARGTLRRGRSASIEDEDSDEEKSYQLTNKIDNLAKILFSRVSAARGCKDSDVRNGRHNYTALDHGPSVCENVGEYMEMEKRSRDRALSICQAYIRRTPRYSLVKQLNNLGSRMDKHWFIVRDTSLKTDRLITLAPLNRNCSLSITPLTKNVLNDLFLALQHPYICPIFDIDFLELESQNYVVVVQPISQGSLKDLIYGIERTGWNEDWNQKYGSRGKGLPLPQVQQMGRQVLEALTFLKERGFPTVVELLQFIFGESSNRQKIIEELLVHDLFRNIDLREMRSAPVTIFRPTLTPPVVNLLDGIKRQNASKRTTQLDIVDEDTTSLHRSHTVCKNSLLDEIYNELSNTAV
ncbi:slowpoke binding protein isoform X5 [Bombus vancouverensis nearcticus]|uniref:slowpoke-binding protein isoform X7 n=1 Tax=Bombus huntii TaxID=85661 RepID=UPI002120E275|nr:slowpoke-binding protein isoform X7 [Bombus huntii]